VALKLSSLQFFGLKFSSHWKKEAPRQKKRSPHWKKKIASPKEKEESSLEEGSASSKDAKLLSHCAGDIVVEAAKGHGARIKSLYAREGRS
jgi:hypothetical protein